jgi:hypothetical protein
MNKKDITKLVSYNNNDVTNQLIKISPVIYQNAKVSVALKERREHQLPRMR